MTPQNRPPVLSSLPLFLRATCYAGIGSRGAPVAILTLMEQIAEVLADHEMILRSGGAPGADIAFETGCNRRAGRKEIFLPWRGFNGNPSPLHEPPEAAGDVAALVHPNWKACRPASQKLHARNVQQVLGQNLDVPAAFVLFWAPEEEGRVQGGTATAVHLAREMCIPTFNLRDESTAERWEMVANRHQQRKPSKPSFWSWLFRIGH